MNTSPKVLSTEDMLKYVDEGLFQAIEATINKVGAGRLTNTQIEMTLATFLGTLVGESCPTQFEVTVNAQAYGEIIRQLGLCQTTGPECEQNEALN